MVIDTEFCVRFLGGLIGMNTQRFSIRGNPFRLSHGRKLLAGYAVFGALLGLGAQDGRSADPNEPPYELIDIGSLDGFGAAAVAINDRGQIVGSSPTDTGEVHGFRYSRGKLVDLGTLPGGTESSALGINDWGQVVGQSSGSDGQRGFLFSNGKMTELGTLGGSTSSAQDINNRGEIAGFATTNSGAIRAFLRRNGEMKDLGTLPGRSESAAFGINNRGQVVGQAFNGDFQRAFLYDNGEMLDLGTLGGLDSAAFAANDRGQVVGNSSNADGLPRGFLYYRGNMIDVGTLGGGSSLAQGINERGQVVGASETADGLLHAFVYQDGAMVDLGTLAGLTSFASDINNKGQIVGFSDGRAVLINPTFPRAGVLDDFDGPRLFLGPEWSGRKGLRSYHVIHDQAYADDGGAIYWQARAFGVDQEAFVTLTNVDQDGRRQGFVLKAQGPGPESEPDYTNGMIVVTYDAREFAVKVKTFIPRGGEWTSYRPVRAKFRDGDQFGVRVYSSGQVRIYRNHLPLGTVTLNAVDQSFFNRREGRIGLLFDASSGRAVFDDFGGGTTP